MKIDRGNLRKYMDKINYDHDKLDATIIEKEIEKLYVKGKINDSG